MIKQKLIRDIRAGDEIISYFILRKKELRQKKSTGEPYLSLEFGDRSGRLNGSLWENVTQVQKAIQPNDIVKVRGKVITYLDKLHLTIEKIRKSTATDQIDPKSFLPVCYESAEAMYQEIKDILASIKTASLTQLISSFINDEEFSTNFLEAPGGKLWHHAYLGGLAEHTRSVMKICQFLAHHFADNVQHDLLLTAAFLHDIGKISEFKREGFIDYSTPGRLIGHINIGFNLALEKISQIQDFPVQMKDQLLHCILSHHGEKDKGSPVVPMTMEALILSYADQLDSSVGAFQRIIEKEKEPEKIWSNYVNLIDRFIYLGKSED